jgi:hypothetical protein
MKRLRMGFALVALATAFAACSSGEQGSTFQRAYKHDAPSAVAPPCEPQVSTLAGARGAAQAGVTFDLTESDEVLVVEREADSYRGGLAGGRSKGRLDRHREWHATGAVVDLPRGGDLRARLADKLVPIPLKHTDVKAQVAIYLASVTVKQQYHNPYDSKIEAVYLFPLPDDAAVRDFVMVIGDRKIRGIIREKEEAQKIYQEARRQGHVASLMTQDRPNIFTQFVANIEPGKQIDIDITYFHSLKYSNGEYEFHFPMVVGPRYNPSGTNDGVGAVPRGTNG